MTHGEKKFIIFFGLALALWRVFELPAVQNAFLQFLAVGQVPITHKTLSPRGVFWVLAIAFSLSLLLIFRKELWRSLGHRRNGVSTEGTTTSETVVIAPGKPHHFSVPNPKLGLRDKKLPMLYVPSLRPFARRAGIILRKAAAAEYDSLKTIFTFIWRVLAFIARHAWRFAEPLIRRFDKWLDRELHKNHLTSEILEVATECWRAVASGRRKPESAKLRD